MLSGPPVTPSVAIDQLLERFLAGSPRQRRSLLPQLEARVDALIPLIPACLDRLDATGDDWAAGTLLQLLVRHGDGAERSALQARFPEGWLATPSAAGLAYGPLQQALLAGLHALRHQALHGGIGERPGLGRSYRSWGKRGWEYRRAPGPPAPSCGGGLGAQRALMEKPPLTPALSPQAGRGRKTLAPLEDRGSALQEGLHAFLGIFAVHDAGEVAEQLAGRRGFSLVLR